MTEIKAGDIVEGDNLKVIIVNVQKNYFWGLILDDVEQVFGIKTTCIGCNSFLYKWNFKGKLLSKDLDKDNYQLSCDYEVTEDIKPKGKKSVKEPKKPKGIFDL